MTQAGNRFEVLHEFLAPARRNLIAGTWDYLMGGAETETTLIRNRMAIDSLAFRPRVLRDVENVDIGGKILGRDFKLPVILAPIGSLQDLVPDGGVIPTKAAASFGALHMLSSVCAPGAEEVAAAAPGYPKVFQLYIRGDEKWVDDNIARVVASGYMALCFTVDLDHYGRRERDLSRRFKTTGRRRASADHFQARFTWRDIDRVKSKLKIPLILKGIATAEDARIAVEHGVDAVYVSNHGGRQLDHGKGGLDVLPEVVEAIGGKAEIYVDGGFMRGTDIVKAMALGANAVGIGRLQGLAVAAAGEEGVVRMLELLADEVTRCLGLLGVSSYGELDSSYLAKVDPIGRRAYASAFPLLDEGY
ncbi:MAG: alpha-hydroxy acid oxidase [Hyphomicrobiaceae bacterium]